MTFRSLALVFTALIAHNNAVSEDSLDPDGDGYWGTPPAAAAQCPADGVSLHAGFRFMAGTAQAWAWMTSGFMYIEYWFPSLAWAGFGTTNQHIDGAYTECVECLNGQPDGYLSLSRPNRPCWEPCIAKNVFVITAEGDREPGESDDAGAENAWEVIEAKIDLEESGFAFDDYRLPIDGGVRTDANGLLTHFIDKPRGIDLVTIDFDPPIQFPDNLNGSRTVSVSSFPYVHGWWYREWANDDNDEWDQVTKDNDDICLTWIQSEWLRTQYTKNFEEGYFVDDAGIVCPAWESVCDTESPTSSPTGNPTSRPTVSSAPTPSPTYKPIPLVNLVMPENICNAQNLSLMFVLDFSDSIDDEPLKLSRDWARNFINEVSDQFTALQEDARQTCDGITLCVRTSLVVFSHEMSTVWTLDDVECMTGQDEFDLLASIPRPHDASDRESGTHHKDALNEVIEGNFHLLRDGESRWVVMLSDGTPDPVDSSNQFPSADICEDFFDHDVSFSLVSVDVGIFNDFSGFDCMWRESLLRNDQRLIDEDTDVDFRVLSRTQEAGLTGACAEQCLPVCDVLADNICLYPANDECVPSSTVSNTRVKTLEASFDFELVDNDASLWIDTVVMSADMLQWGATCPDFMFVSARAQVRRVSGNVLVTQSDEIRLNGDDLGIDSLQLEFNELTNDGNILNGGVRYRLDIIFGLPPCTHFLNVPYLDDPGSFPLVDYRDTGITIFSSSIEIEHPLIPGNTLRQPLTAIVSFCTKTSSPTTSPTDSPTSRPTKSPTERPTRSPTGRPTRSPTERPTRSPSERPSRSPTERPTKSPTERPTESPSMSPFTTPEMCPDYPLDIVIVFDESSTCVVADDDCAMYKQNMIDLVNAFMVGPDEESHTRFGIVAYTDRSSRPTFLLNEPLQGMSKTAIINRINAVECNRDPTNDLTDADDGLADANSIIEVSGRDFTVPKFIIWNPICEPTTGVFNPSTGEFTRPICVQSRITELEENAVEVIVVVSGDNGIESSDFECLPHEDGCLFDNPEFERALRSPGRVERFRDCICRTNPPTHRPTKSPTDRPTRSPTERPTKSPTERPTRSPTDRPTRSPTERPTRSPTDRPTRSPTNRPTRSPTERPTRSPTERPTKSPTESPLSVPDDICEQPVDIVIVFDESSACLVTDEQCEVYKQNMVDVVNVFDVGSNAFTQSRFGIVAYTDRSSRPSFLLDQADQGMNRDAILARIDQVVCNRVPGLTIVEADDGLADANGIIEISGRGFNIPKFIIWNPICPPTPGIFNPSTGEFSREICVESRVEELEENDIEVLTVVSGDNGISASDYDCLPHEAGCPVDNPFFIRGATLPTYLERILSCLCVSRSPTASPSQSPTNSPTSGPTDSPTRNPSTSPTERPTKSPTDRPTKSPTERPTRSPTKRPTKSPTERPTRSPTDRPTRSPTNRPTKSPTERPTRSPTDRPTKSPTERPTRNPSMSPSMSPTLAPTGLICRDFPVDVVIVIDESRTCIVSDDECERYKQNLMDVVNLFQVGPDPDTDVRFAAIAYRDRVMWGSPFTAGVEKEAMAAILSEIDCMHGGGRLITDADDGLTKAVDLLRIDARPDVTQVILWNPICDNSEDVFNPFRREVIGPICTDERIASIESVPATVVTVASGRENAMMIDATDYSCLPGHCQINNEGYMPFFGFGSRNAFANEMMACICVTRSPTESPTQRPSRSPTKRPTDSPSMSPTTSPSESPTETPTDSPTQLPTESPTKRPTRSPTNRPTKSPTPRPTKSPTERPTRSPTDRPSKSPTKRPTKSPLSVPDDICEQPVDIVIVFDESSACLVTDEQCAVYKQNMVDVVNVFDVGPNVFTQSRFGIVAYTDRSSRPSFLLDQADQGMNRDAILARIDQVVCNRVPGLTIVEADDGLADANGIIEISGRGFNIPKFIIWNPICPPTPGIFNPSTGEFSREICVESRIEELEENDIDVLTVVSGENGISASDYDCLPHEAGCPIDNPFWIRGATFPNYLERILSCLCVSRSPTASPSQSPTNSPTDGPTDSPTRNPTESPTERPTTSPSQSPSDSPTTSPTQDPTGSPTVSPTQSPTRNPSTSPSESPSESPTRNPTQSPSQSPTESPSTSPTESPTRSPSDSPSRNPSRSPSSSPSMSPTMSPTGTQCFPPNELECPQFYRECGENAMNEWSIDLLSWAYNDDEDWTSVEYSVCVNERQTPMATCRNSARPNGVSPLIRVSLQIPCKCEVCMDDVTRYMMPYTDDGHSAYVSEIHQAWVWQQLIYPGTCQSLSLVLDGYAPLNAPKEGIAQLVGKDDRKMTKLVDVPNPCHKVYVPDVVPVEDECNDNCEDPDKSMPIYPEEMCAKNCPMVTSGVDDDSSTETEWRIEVDEATYSPNNDESTFVYRVSTLNSFISDCQFHGLGKRYALESVVIRLPCQCEAQSDSFLRSVTRSLSPAVRSRAMADYWVFEGLSLQPGQSTLLEIVVAGDAIGDEGVVGTSSPVTGSVTLGGWQRCQGVLEVAVPNPCKSECVYGYWGPWLDDLSVCSKTCGGGHMYRHRECLSVCDNGERVDNCLGESHAMTPCNTHKCGYEGPGHPGENESPLYVQWNSEGH